jgi:hypothetical protein
VTLSGHSPSADERQLSAKRRHSRTGWIELPPLPDPLAQPEPDFQFDPTVRDEKRGLDGNVGYSGNPPPRVARAVILPDSFVNPGLFACVSNSWLLPIISINAGGRRMIGRNGMSVSRFYRQYSLIGKTRHENEWGCFRAVCGLHWGGLTAKPCRGAPWSVREPDAPSG